MFFIELKAVMIALLCWVVVEDLRTYRIRNGAVLALLCVAVPLIAAKGQAASLAHALFGLLAFGALLLAYSRQLLGGGDAKLMSVALFWTGPSQASLFTVFLLGLTLLYWFGARIGVVPHRLVQDRMAISFGPCIAGAWVVTLLASGG